MKKLFRYCLTGIFSFLLTFSLTAQNDDIVPYIDFDFLQINDQVIHVSWTPYESIESLEIELIVNGTSLAVIPLLIHDSEFIFDNNEFPFAGEEEVEVNLLFTFFDEDGLLTNGIDELVTTVDDLYEFNKYIMFCNNFRTRGYILGRSTGITYTMKCLCSRVNWVMDPASVGVPSLLYSQVSSELAPPYTSIYVSNLVNYMYAGDAVFRNQCAVNLSGKKEEDSSLGNEKNELSFNYFQNDDVLTISNLINSNLSFKLLDLTGKAVELHYNVEGTIIVLDVGNVNTGIYWFQSISAVGEIQSKKIFIK